MAEQANIQNADLMAVMLESELPFYLQVACEAALDAGGILRRNFNAFKIAVFKSDADISIPNEQYSERVILERLQSIVSDHKIAVEGAEQVINAHSNSEYQWYIDPLDGTANYQSGIAYFSVSLSLTFQGEPVLGVVYNPVTNQLFAASLGKGATLNERSISPSRMNPLINSSVAFVRGLPRPASNSVEQRARQIEFALRASTKRTISMWSPSLDWCLAASGGLSGVVAFDSAISGQIAGIMIAKEAGCAVRCLDGSPWSLKNGGMSLVGASEETANALINRIKSSALRPESEETEQS